MENKRGQFGIYGLVIGLVLTLVLLAFFVWNTQFRFVVLGTGLAVGSFFILFKADINKKVKTSLFVGLLAVGLLFVLMSGVLQSITGTDFSTNEVYLPNYVSIWCDRLPNEIQTTFSVNDKSSSACGFNGVNSINAYVPYGCKYIPSKQINYKIVENTFDCSTIGVFSWTGSAQAGTTINVANQQKICFNENQIGTVSVSSSATPYGLRINNANGKVVFTGNCDLKSNIDSLANIDYIPGFSDNPIVLTPESGVDHYINGYSAVVNDKDVVTLDNQRIYIYAIGKYYPIQESDDGFFFANSLLPKTSSKLICVPSQNPLCVGGTKVIENVADAECSMFNKPEGYISVGSGKECSYNCVSGKLVQSDCRIIASCPADKPYRNPETNICEATGTTIEEKQCTKWWQIESTQTDYKYNILFFKFGATTTPVCKVNPLINIVAVVVVIIVLGSVALYSMKPKRKKK